MQKFLSFFVAIIFAMNCLGQSDSSKCKKFRTGDFTYNDSAKNTVNVKRKKKKQYEYNMGTGERTVAKIRWISDCEYELTQIWSNSKSGRKRNTSKTKVVITKILDEDKYEYSCGCHGVDLSTKERSIMTRIYYH